MLLHPDRLIPSDPTTRNIARSLYKEVQSLPIVSPHGHTMAAWFAGNEPFPDPAKLFVQPDHYVYRMLYSQGVSLEDLEIGKTEIKDPRGVWRIFASTRHAASHEMHGRRRRGKLTIMKRNVLDFTSSLFFACGARRQRSRPSLKDLKEDA